MYLIWIIRSMNMRLRSRRRELEISQRELGRRVGLTQADISRIERSDWIPPAEYRALLASELLTTSSDLFEDMATSAAS